MKPMKLETKIGNVWINPTEANHVYIEFGHHLNVENEGPEPMDRRGPVCVRGIAYAGSIHVYQWSDGSWNIGPEYKEDKYATDGKRLSSPSDRYHSLYLTRRDKFLENASDAARKTVGEVVLTAFKDWAKSHAEVFNTAEENHRLDQRLKRFAEIKELQAKIDKLQAEIQVLSLDLDIDIKGRY